MAPGGPWCLLGSCCNLHREPKAGQETRRGSQADLGSNSYSLWKMWGRGTLNHLLPWDWSTCGMWVPEVFCFPNVSRHQIVIKGDLYQGWETVSGTKMKHQFFWWATHSWALWKRHLAWESSIWPGMLGGCPIPALVPESWQPGN